MNTTLNEIARYLSGFEKTQRAMHELFQRKRIALRESDAASLIAIANEEAGLVERLKTHLADRQQLLDRANKRGDQADSLKSLVQRVDPDDTTGLLTRTRQLETAATKLRHETWVQWIVAQRSYKQYSNLLDHIAHRGKQAATYDRRERATTGAGTLLDASV